MKRTSVPVPPPGVAMDLSEFVATALVQIASGIRHSDEELNKMGAIVNPRHVKGVTADKANLYGYVSEGERVPRAVHLVEFDIAVTAAEGKEKKGAIGIVVGSVGLGSQGRSEESSASVSRIRFKVPVAFPNAKYST